MAWASSDLRQLKLWQHKRNKEERQRELSMFSKTNLHVLMSEDIHSRAWGSQLVDQEGCISLSGCS